jgi:phosphoglycerol transferase MdoB-like AlkP superfamily enzyme
MDAFLLMQSLKPKENFVGERKLDTVYVLQLVISVAISVYAAYLSWQCSSGDSTALRVIYALFAYLFGILYVLYYVLVRAGQCTK